MGESISKLLANYDIRITEQRKRILKVLISSSKPLSASEIYNQLQQNNYQVRLSTIYRNLSNFHEKGLIKELNFAGKNQNYYEFINDHHHHLLCTSCGEILCLDCPVQDYESSLARETGYEISEHKIKIYGLCPQCKK